jgi:hypothetical protein
LKQYLPDDPEHLYPIRYALSFENGYFFILSAQCEYINSTMLNCVHGSNTMHPGVYPMVLLMVYPDDEEYFIYVSTFTLEPKSKFKFPYQSTYFNILAPVAEEPLQVSNTAKKLQWAFLSAIFSLCTF